MKQELKNKVGFALFIAIFISFVVLRITQSTVSDENNNVNQAVNNPTEILNTEKANFSLSLEIRDSYSNMTYEIDQKGQYDYQKLLLGLQSDPIESKVLSTDELVELQASISQSDFFELDSAYRPETTSSKATLSILNISWGNNENSVLCEGDCPNSFNGLVDQVRNLWTN